METFFVTLPSNVLNKYHDNRIGNYKTILPSTLRLDNSWRVGLSSIHYTNSWFNLRHFNEISLVKYQDDNKKYSNINVLPPGRYTLDELLEEISKRVAATDEVAKRPVLSYNRYSRKITQVYGRSKSREYITYKLGKELQEFLGITDGFISQRAQRLNAMAYEGDYRKVYQSLADAKNQPVVIVENDVLESANSFDETGGIHSLMVYSDVVDFSVVGDTRAQLLRVVEIPPHSKFGETVVLTYERPYFLPLATKEISSIEIDIKDDTGSPIDFKFGRVEITLQFIKNG